jgi:hypothetical protein
MKHKYFVAYNFSAVGMSGSGNGFYEVENELDSSEVMDDLTDYINKRLKEDGGYIEPKTVVLNFIKVR